MLLYVVCTAGDFVWNEGGVVPATCYLRLISRCMIFHNLLTRWRTSYIHKNFEFVSLLKIIEVVFYSETQTQHVVGSTGDLLAWKSVV
jgi:hypothetical protein